MPLGALVLVTGLALQGAASTAPTAASTDALGEAYFLFIQGRTLEMSGDLTGAIAAYHKALELTPTAAEVHAELAGLFARDNKPDDSVAEALAALKIDETNPEAHRILGLVQAALADRTLDAARQTALMTEAVSHLEQALAGGGRDPGAQFTLGRLYVRVGRDEKGIATLRQFLLDEPGYPDAMMLLAQAYDRTHQPAEAVSVLQELVAAHPDDVRARSWLADLFEQAGRWTDAAAAWGDLAQRSPSNLTYQIHRAASLANTGDLVAGRQALLDVTKAAPREIAAWYLLSQVERRAGDAVAAEDAARRIGEIDPKDARGPLALAEAKSARGDHRGAIDTLDPLVNAASDEDVANGTFARMAEELARAWQESGDRIRAVSVLESARRRDPRDQPLLFALASAYERAERMDQAERVLRDLVVSDPQNAVALNYLGYMLADHGKNLGEAVDYIKRALAIEPANPSYLDSLGWAYVKQAKLDLAREPLEQAAGALPRTSVILDHLGELCFQLKRYRDAESAWTRALSGDREGIDVAAVTKKRDRAKELAGK